MAGVDVGEAFAAEAEDGFGLGAFWDGELLLAAEDGHGDGVAEGGLGEGDGHFVDEFLAAPLEVRVLLEEDGDVEVSGMAAAHAGVAGALVDEADAGVDAGGDLDGVVARVAHAALASAGLAGFGDDAALAPAGGAGGDGGEGAEYRVLYVADLAGAVAGAAGLGGGAGFRAGAFAGFAGLGMGQLEGFGRAEGGFLEGDLQVVAQVRALCRLLTGAIRAAASAAEAAGAGPEEHVEDVADAEALGAESALRAGVAELVVHLALLGSREHLVGLVDLLEPLLGLVVARVDVGVVLGRELAVCGPDLLHGGSAVDVEDFVIISFFGHGFVSVNRWLSRASPLASLPEGEVSHGHAGSQNITLYYVSTVTPGGV